VDGDEVAGGEGEGLLGFVAGLAGGSAQGDLLGGDDGAVAVDALAAHVPGAGDCHEGEDGEEGAAEEADFTHHNVAGEQVEGDGYEGEDEAHQGECGPGVAREVADDAFGPLGKERLAAGFVDLRLFAHKFQVVAGIAVARVEQQGAFVVEDGAAGVLEAVVGVAHVVANHRRGPLRAFDFAVELERLVVEFAFVGLVGLVECGLGGDGCGGSDEERYDGENQVFHVVVTC